MARIRWYGTLMFGPISVPVGLAPATTERAKSGDVSFKLIHRDCGGQIAQRRYCTECGLELTKDEVMRGLPVDGELIPVEDTLLEALEENADTTIEVKVFVPINTVDPVWFDRTYFLVPPEKEKSSNYALLLETMMGRGVGAIVHYFDVRKEKYGLIRELGGVLVLETLFLDGDVFRPDFGVHDEAPDKWRSLAEELVEAMTEDFDPAILVSDYRESLHEIVEQVKAGRVKKVTTKKPVRVDATLVALKKSVAEAKKRKKAMSKAA